MALRTGSAEHNGSFRGNNHAFVTVRMATAKCWADDSSQRNLDANWVKLTTVLGDVADLVPGAKLKGCGLMQGTDVVAGDLAGEICTRANDNVPNDKYLVIKASGNEDQVAKVLAPLTTSMGTFRNGLSVLLDVTRDGMAERVILAAEEGADQ